MITLGVSLVILAAFLYWFYTKGLIIIAERNAKKSLESMLFPEGENQKEKIINSMSHITKEKYSSELLLDYFLKIKGLQVVNLFDPVNFWTRKYLMSPTKLKLNYFEQVRFYETFLNYPDMMSKVIRPDDLSTNLFSSKKNPIRKFA